MFKKTRIYCVLLIFFSDQRYKLLLQDCFSKSFSLISLAKYSITIHYNYHLWYLFKLQVYTSKTNRSCKFTALLGFNVYFYPMLFESSVEIKKIESILDCNDMRRRLYLSCGNSTRQIQTLIQTGWSISELIQIKLYTTPQLYKSNVGVEFSSPISRMDIGTFYLNIFLKYIIKFNICLLVWGF